MADAQVDQKLTVLIIEEKSDLRAFYMNILVKSEKFEVKNSATKKEALEILEKDSAAIHVILLDWILDNETAHVFLQELRKNVKYDHIEFFVMSDELSQEDSFLIAEIGIESSFSKRLTANEFLLKMEKIKKEYFDLKSIKNELKEIRHSINMNNVLKCSELLKNNALLKEIESNPKVVYIGGEVRILKKQYGEAVEFLKNFLKTHQANSTENLKTLNTLGKALCFVGKYDEALTVYERLEAKSPKNLSHKVMMGDALLGLDEVQAAQEKYNEVLTQAPKDSGALLGMGKSHSMAGNYDQAKSFFEKIQGNFESLTLASFYNNKGIALVRKGKYTEAIQFYENALQFFDKFKGHIYFNLGMAYYRSGNIASALSCFQAALATDDLDLLSEKKVLKEFQEKGIERFTADYKSKFAKRKR